MRYNEKRNEKNPNKRRKKGMKTKMMKVMLLLVVLMAILTIVAMPSLGLTIPDPNYSAAGTEGISTAGSNIAGIAATVGVGVAIVILIWLAIKYITAAPSDKADIKKSATAYVIGAILLFAASGVLALIQTFATDFGESLESASQYEVIRKA